MASYDLPPAHLEEEPRETVYSVGEYEPTTIGDIPELASVFQSLHDQIALAQMPDFMPDESVEWEILPIGKGDSRGTTGEQPPLEEEPSKQVRDIGFLFTLREEFGQGSSVVEVSLRNRDETHKENRPEPYYAALLRNPDGSLHAVVADTNTEDNSLFVWRTDVTDLPADQSWTTVFAGTKKSAMKLQAVDVRHSSESYMDRVRNYLTMPTDQFMDVVTSQPGKRPRV